MNFTEKLNSAIQKQNSLLCIGLDTVPGKIPVSLQQDQHSLLTFNKAIIDATHDLVCAYKPNSAFYEPYGPHGIEQLKMTCDYIREKNPEIVIILDAKRGDIGSTNEGYVKYAFDYLGANAITLHPYLGKEAIQPFLDHAEKGCIILCRTSNPGAGEFQDVSVDNKPLYQHIARKVSSEWNSNHNCALVVGATYPEELSEVRKIVGDMPILLPGIGAQGGDLEKSLKAGLTEKKDGLIITVSRSVIYASKETDFAEKAREEALRLKDEINSFRK